MKNVVVVCGPTASGKSDTAIEIAKQFGGEVISADSMQIYRGLDTGTAKITSEEMCGVPHHMIDICDPEDNYSAAEFQRDAKKLIRGMHEKGILPVVCGGTGFYIHSLLFDIDFPGTCADGKLRAELDAKSSEELYSELESLDPQSTQRIHLNDRKRIIRRLEILKNNSDTSFDFRKRNTEWNFVCAGLTAERSLLYERINARVDIMREKGLEEEVRSVCGKACDSQSMQAIGYKEIIEYLAGGCSIDDAYDNIKRNTRRYAKRQLTWFRRYDFVRWFDICNPSYKNEISEYISSALV